MLLQSFTLFLGVLLQLLEVAMAGFVPPFRDETTKAPRKKTSSQGHKASPFTNKPRQ